MVMFYSKRHSYFAVTSQELKMKKHVKLSSLLLACIGISLFFGGSFLQGAGNRPTISAAERALAMLEVQNTMSKHAYYYAAGKIEEEFNNIWVKEGGEYAATASKGKITGLKKLKKMTLERKHDNEKKALEEMSRIYSDIKNIPENLGTGTDLVIHTQTTPVIEIAGDGKTAKGVWYSPGIGLTPHFRDGKVNVEGIFFWEKYGVDFVKEDGRWKIWHMQMVYDFMPGIDKKWTDFGSDDAQSTENTGWPPKAWTPKTIPELSPRLPEPYYTFSETFSYQQTP